MDGFEAADRVFAAIAMQATFALLATAADGPLSGAAAVWCGSMDCRRSSRAVRLDVQRLPLNGTTFCFCAPRPSMPSVMTSPGLSHIWGFIPMPTPGGVPVVITSPGRSVM